MSNERTDRLVLAIEKYNTSNLSYKDVAELYDVSISTMRRHGVGITKTFKRGPPTSLSTVTETIIVSLIMFMCDIGWSHERDDVIDIVENYCKNTNQSEIFKNDGRFSCEWFMKFMIRHPQLSKRIANNMQSTRAVAMNKGKLIEWFDKLKQVFDEHDFYNHPERLWNCDESGFQCNAGRCQIICRKGTKNPKKITVGNEKKHWTVLSCCNANGQYLPHKIISQGKNLYSNWMLHGREDFMYNTSESGWMETEQFLNWFKQVFVKQKYRKKKKKKKEIKS